MKVKVRDGLADGSFHGYRRQPFRGFSDPKMTYFEALLRQISRDVLKFQVAFFHTTTIPPTSLAR
jgi:hypothetical protein